MPHLRPEVALLHKAHLDRPKTVRTWPRPGSTRMRGPGLDRQALDGPASGLG